MSNINAANASHGSPRRRAARRLWLVLSLGCAVDARRLPVVDDQVEAEQHPADAAAASAVNPKACIEGSECDLDASAPSSAVPAAPLSSLETLDAACDPADGGCLPPCDGCRIDGACIAAGLQNPETLCQICDPARDPRAWSPNDGLVCDDGRYCTQLAACSDGQCARVLARDCGFDSCNETQRRCVCSGDC